MPVTPLPMTRFRNESVGRYAGDGGSMAATSFNPEPPAKAICATALVVTRDWSVETAGVGTRRLRRGLRVKRVRPESRILPRICPR